jgi:hypothetical protein
MSGVTAEQDNEATDYRITRQGKEQRAEGKALRECALLRFPIKGNDRRTLWRSDRSNLVADQLPAGRHFCEDDAALELAAGGFAAVLAFQRDPIDRDRDIAAVNLDFHVRIHFNGAEVGRARFQVGQALRLGNDHTAGVNEGVIVRPNPFERGGIPLHQGGAVLFDYSADFLLRSFVVGRTRGL